MSASKADEKVRVRVLEARALSLAGENGSTLYRAGESFEISAKQAKRLSEQGFVDVISRLRQSV